MQLTEILARNARLYGDEIALIEREPKKKRRVELTWKQFYHQANAFSRALRDRFGIEKGDRVIHLMMNCIDWLPVYFGILRAGAVAVPLNFRFEAANIAGCTALSEAKAMVLGPEFIDRIRAVKSELDRHVSHYIYAGPPELCPEFAIPYSEILRGVDVSEPMVSITSCDGAGIYFTSGTTGEPKGVYLRHRQLEFSCYVENRHHNQTHRDNFLCIPPLYHTGAKMHWFGNFIVGARAVILKGVSPRAILEAVSEEHITIVWLLVPWAHDILVALENGDLQLSDYKLDQWRLMHIGAQPVPPSLIEKWQRFFPAQDYDTNYGLTEATGPGCVHLGLEKTHKVGSIGRAGFDWECRVVDDQGNQLESGHVGELLVKGPGVMERYYGNPEATQNTLKDGWLHTGDIVRQDSEGFFWLVDRKKDVIITGGENIFPVEIENFLMSHEAVLDAGVIGVPDHRLGEVAAAVISVKPGRQVSEEEIRDFCAAMPRYKRPRQIFFDKVPRNPTGKIEKPGLRKKYA
ncbi:MAG: class I adenylate-forming enzyme family protein [Desulfosalsimonas sp.]|uniref:class I adenylate-forming enzyme family protein n=1 Tax=Desulfosalsimonas sp. TaxID=3073848 RepID=UPI003970C386